LQIFGAIKKQANSELTERGNILGVWWPKLCTKKLSTWCSCIAMEEVYSLNKEDDTYNAICQSSLTLFHISCAKFATKFHRVGINLETTNRGGARI
jgi:hypothetical protein